MTAALIAATRVEVLKLKRTLALAVAFAVPLALLCMLAANILSRDPGPLPGVSPWNGLIVNFAYFLWCLLAWPLLVTLQTALLAGLEHGQHHWKDLFTLPIPRWCVYAAKLIVATLLLGVSLVTLGVGLAAEGMLLNFIRPSLGLTPPIPWLDLARGMATILGASLLLLALLMWVAVRWPSFAVPTGVGITGTVVGLIVSLSSRSDEWARLFPWSMALSAVAPVDDRRTLEGHAIALGLGIVGGLVVAIAGAWDTERRDIT